MDFKQLFEKGISFEKFIELDEDTNREKTLELYENIVLEEELIQRIRQIQTPIKILAFAEIWCPDCMINVPALQKMKAINEEIQMTILPREGNEEVMENYKLGGKPKIPTFIVMNEMYQELGFFIEMPKTLKDIAARGNQVEVIVGKRKYRKGEYIRDTIKEILNIIDVK
ncbi:conserved hypothetical protein [Alkaliphilus metalliredigens QYMF]|uniref:Thioredoxin family protein n=1 Tax=Alkaliphilus metalliredigens (strain QYMF) TaxID=293826 RepID=A6TWM6_ALKMQ|nr:thioredoxin family protein [Alkaliphilus metalliredigens]ABR50594.1 conserved hypothetical protein [Alkaliphilus metalliredigens QYMF]